MFQLNERELVQDCRMRPSLCAPYRAGASWNPAVRIVCTKWHLLSRRTAPGWMAIETDLWWKVSLPAYHGEQEGGPHGLGV